MIAVVNFDETVRIHVLGDVFNQGKGRFFPLHFQQVSFNKRWRFFRIIVLGLFLAFFRGRFWFLEEVSIKARGKSVVLRLFHDRANEVLPLLLGLFDLHHMSEEPAFDLG